MDTTGTGGVELGDKRRTARLIKLTERLAAQPQALKRRRKDESALGVGIILAREENPPPGHEPVVWRLLTNRLVETPGQVAELLDWYRRRWLIEIFFRILKCGCKVEPLQLGRIERLERALAIYFIIAWRILHVVTSGQQCPELPCDVDFDPEEWKTAWLVNYRQRPPEEPPTLNVN